MTAEPMLDRSPARGKVPPEERLSVRTNPLLQDQAVAAGLDVPATPQRPRLISRVAVAFAAWYVRSWPVGAQGVGLLGALGGVYLILGLGASLIIGGVALFAAGFLREAKVI